MSDARYTALRNQYPRVTATGPENTMRYLGFRNVNGNGRVFPTDLGFPQTITSWTDFAGVDENTADLLYGLVRAINPQVCLETGTHKGRSTRAIVAALYANAHVTLMPKSYIATFTPGHLWTVDAEDWKILTSGAIPPEHAEYVTPIIGFTPDVFSQPPLESMEGINFAFLDGDHSTEGLDAELEFVRLRHAPGCVVAIDNADDDGWPNIRRHLVDYRDAPLVTIPNSTGMALIVFPS